MKHIDFFISMNFEMINLIAEKLEKHKETVSSAVDKKTGSSRLRPITGGDYAQLLSLGKFFMERLNPPGPATQGIRWLQPEVVSVYGQMDDDYDGRSNGRDQ